MSAIPDLVGPDPTKPPKWYPWRPGDDPGPAACPCASDWRTVIHFRGAVMGLASGYCKACGQVYLSAPNVPGELLISSPKH